MKTRIYGQVKKMITDDKVQIYIKYKGDMDWFSRIASPEERNIISGNDFSEIDSLIQDIIVIKTNHASEKYAGEAK